MKCQISVSARKTPNLCSVVAKTTPNLWFGVFDWVQFQKKTVNYWC